MGKKKKESKPVKSLGSRDASAENRITNVLPCTDPHHHTEMRIEKKKKDVALRTQEGGTPFMR